MTDLEGKSIRIMIYNIHRWTGQDPRLDITRLATVIRKSGADIVALNEILHPMAGDRSGCRAVSFCDPSRSCF